MIKKKIWIINQYGSLPNTGIGALITKDVEKNTKYMGLNSIDLKSLVLLKRRIKYGK